MKSTSLLLLLSAGKKHQPVYDFRYVEDNLKLIPDVSLQDGAAKEGSQDTIHSFFMSRFEVTNGLYCWYLQLLAHSDTAAYRAALPDTLVWREKLSYNEPYVDYYLRHPAYADYPLVGVNYAQATAFCVWLNANYNKWPLKKFANAQFDLPAKEEWMAAAQGGLHNSLFPWGGPYMRNSKGQILANFSPIDEASVYRKEIPYVNFRGDTIMLTCLVGSREYGDYAGVAGSLTDNADITAPVNAYAPNAYGLYNMSGNVEEMVREKGITKGGSWSDPGYYLQINAEEKYTDSTAASSERGFRIMMRVKQ